MNKGAYKQREQDRDSAPDCEANQDAAHSDTLIWCAIHTAVTTSPTAANATMAQSSARAFLLSNTGIHVHLLDDFIDCIGDGL